MTSNADEPVPESVEPSERELQDALGSVRTDGLYDSKKPPTEHRALVHAARRLSSKPDDAAKIKDALEKAIERVGGKHTEAMRVLFGLTEALAGRNVEIGIRRPKAMQLSEHGSDAVDGFRKNIEQKWLIKMAVWIKTSLTDPTRLVSAAIEDRPDPPAHNEPPTLPQPDTEPPEAEPPELPQDDERGGVAPDEPAHGQGWDAVRRFIRRRARILLTVVGVAGIGTAIVLVSAHGRSDDRAVSDAPALSDGCGPTTVQLFTNTAQQILVYAPGSERAEHGWVGIFLTPGNAAESSEKTETFRYGEVRQFAMQSTNETSETEHNLIARIGLTQSAKLEPNTTCLYRPTSYRSGTHFAGTGLTTPGGIKIGNLAPHEKVDVTFKEQLPTVGRPGNIAKTYGAIASEAKIGGPDWIEEHSALVELELIGGA